MDKYKLELSDEGYYTVSNPPDIKILKQYYEKKYWQEVTGHNAALDSVEVAYIENSVSLKGFAINQFLNPAHKKLLDIGTGEGHTLKYFDTNGWDVFGLDFSNYGLKRHHPDMLSKLVVGDIYESIDKLIEIKEKFSLIILDNVLEHVLSPKHLLQKIKIVLSDEKNAGILVKVPNDFSAIQTFLTDEKIVDRQYWIAPPDHLNYFNVHSLKSFFETNGFVMHVLFADWPIEFDLLNPRTNYINDKIAGKESHRARMMSENLIAENSMEDILNFYTAAAKVGIGRTITGLFSLNI